MTPEIKEIEEENRQQGAIIKYVKNSFYSIVKLPGEKYWKIAVGLRIVSSKRFKTELAARVHIWLKPQTLTILTTIAIIETKTTLEK